MEPTLTTSWTLIEGAAGGKQADREEFVRRYAPVARVYLAVRWKSVPLFTEIEDTIQEVFIECFKQGGILGKADQERPGGFRAFFYGVVRNMALKMERRGARQPKTPGSVVYRANDAEAAEESPSTAFDRAWARSLVKEARYLYSARAHAGGERAVRRAELLDLRFRDSLPIREIAKTWNMDNAYIHSEYAQARKEFKATLMEVLAAEHPGSRVENEKVLADLLAILG